MKKSQNLTNQIYQKSGFYFVLFLVLALIAFWPNYFSHIFTGIDKHLHFHGLTMTMWTLMLICQGLFIRFKKYSLHKTVGKFSYILMPLLLAAGFHTAHITVSKIHPVYGSYYSSIALMFNSLVLVGVFYILAISYRKRPAVHARYMICTLLPMFTPVTDRLIYFHFRPLLQFVPVLDNRPMVMIYGFLLANLILLVLMIRDLFSRPRRFVFLVAFIMVLVYQISVLAFYRFGAWRKVGDWLMELPLS